MSVPNRPTTPTRVTPPTGQAVRPRSGGQHHHHDGHHRHDGHHHHDAHHHHHRHHRDRHHRSYWAFGLGYGYPGLYGYGGYYRPYGYWDYSYPYYRFDDYRSPVYPDDYYGGYETYSRPAYVPMEPEAEAAAPTNAQIAVRLPNPDAEVWFEDHKMSATGATRVFESPDLESEKVYTYTIRAAWTQDGRQVKEERKVDVKSGHVSLADFTKPATVERPATPDRDIPPPP